ncbi:MAG: hypothetical protein SOZ62_06525 [Eubacteriales bacterium]|nr:hypothetical protein [Eubacteriales bacterium]
MKRIIRIAFLCILLFFAFGIRCHAKEPTEYTDEFFDTANSLAQNVFDSSDNEDTIDEKCNFSYIIDFFFSSLETSVENNSTLYATMLLICVAVCIAEICLTKTSSKTVTVCIAISLSLIIFRLVKPSFDVIISYLSDISKLSEALIPISTGILVSGGAVNSAGAIAVAMSTLNVIWDKLCISVLVPISTSMLGFSIANTFSPSFNVSSISSCLKKTYMTIIGFLSMTATALFGMQTVIAASKDTLASKSLKFFVGSSIPIAGSTVSSSLSTVSASLSVIKSTVGIGSVLVLFGILTPTFIYVFTVRFLLSICATICSSTGCSSSEKVYRSFMSVLDMLIALLLIVSVSFIIVMAIFLKTEFPIS